MLPITRLKVFGVAMSLVGAGFTNAYATTSVQKSAVVRVFAADGTAGLGNFDPTLGHSRETVDEALTVLRTRLAPALRGWDATRPNALLEAIDKVISGHLGAKAAIEMACVDLTARHLGIAVHTYLGGAVADRVRFNAWIGVVSADAAANEARGWLDKGFRSAKIKVIGDPAADRDRVRAVREAVGYAMRLRVDANASYDVRTAIAVGHELEPFDLELFEQPVAADDLAGMAKVQQSIGIPVMADESIGDHASLIAVIRSGSADIVKLKVMKQGGPCGVSAWPKPPLQRVLRVVIGHGCGFGINTLAEIMLPSTCRNVLDGLECASPLKTADDIVTPKLNLRTGEMSIPDGLGLGAVLDEEKVACYAYDG